jgi:predicted negative regulator of RcsB-dependent stress response
MFFGLTVGEIVDYIILGGALVAAIYKIYDFFAKPTSKLKQRISEKKDARINTVLDQRLPQVLYDHDLETRDKYKSDR